MTDIKMRRFATGREPPVDFQAGGGRRGRSRSQFPNLSTVPWKLQLEGGPATVCGLERPAG